MTYGTNIFALSLSSSSGSNSAVSDASDTGSEFDDENVISTTSSSSDDEERPRPRRRQIRHLDPLTDEDDPSSCASSDHDEVPDRFGWKKKGTPHDVRRFQGAERGPSYNTMGMSPLDHFFKFFTQTMFGLLVTWTNRALHAAYKPATSMAEIRAFFGITLLMGVVRLNNIADYWSTRPGLRNQLIASTMTRTRFLLLSKFIRCSDPNTSPDNWPKDTSDQRAHFYHHTKRHPLYQVQPLWDDILQRCRDNYNLGRDVAIDEAMIRYKGFKSFVKKFFMPCKPIRAGFKVYALCDSASYYMGNFKVHPRYTSKIYTISKDLIRPVYNKCHRVYCDKYYTGVALAKKLLRRRTYLTGAVMTSRAGLPTALSARFSRNGSRRRANHMRRFKKTRRGTMYFRKQAKLSYVMWNDSRPMTLLSTAHQAWRNKGTNFVQRNFSTDGVSPKAIHQVPAPKQAIDYIQHMGGVDRNDQLRAYHTCTRKSNIWWKQLVFFLLDICRVNAYICHSHDRRKPLRQQDFIYEVVEGLIDGYAYGNDPGRRHYAARKYTRAREVPAHNGPIHRLEQLKGKNEWGKACIACKRAGRTCAGRRAKPIVTKYGCRACGAFFCKISKNPDCFYSFHGGRGMNDAR